MVNHMKKTVGIVGGGAAGMTAAIAAARCGAEVTILEGGERLGKKILSTGNGKCNLGNTELGEAWYYTNDPSFLRARLEQFGTEETIAFFRSLGLMVKQVNGGLYPVSEQASSVLDVLRFEVRELGIRVLTGHPVTALTREDGTGKLKVHTPGAQRGFDRVVLACGGKAAPKTGSDGSGYRLAKSLGHSLVPVVPALVQLKCREDWFPSVAGVRAKAAVTLGQRTDGMQADRELMGRMPDAGGQTDRGLMGRTPVEDSGQTDGTLTETGEVQFTDYGISGIPVFQLSRAVNYALRERTEVEIVLDFLPGRLCREWEYTGALLRERLSIAGSRTVEEYFAGTLNKKLMSLFIRLAGLRASEPVRNVPEEKLCRVLELCRGLTVHATGSKSFDSAQVCAGGVPLSELKETMESRKVPGVFFAGELLDVDGKCGGYNLQWAWCSGYLAGRAAAERETGFYFRE